MNNNNNLHSDEEDSKDISIEEANLDQNSARITIIAVTSNRIKSKQENEDELCSCGDPKSHKDECSLYCGLAPCEDKMIKFPKCSHLIHETCLDQLLYTRLSRCPLCRSSIDSWRRSRHYHQIEREIVEQFQSDTERAIRLSQKMYEQEQRKQNANRESRTESRDHGESERDHRERSRSRERERNNGEHTDRYNTRDSHRHHHNRNRNHGHREHRERYDRNHQRNRNNRNDRNHSRYFT